MYWLLLFFVGALPIISADNQTYEYYLQKANRLKDAYQFTEAIVLLDSAVAIKGTDAHPYAVRAYCHYSLGNTDKAIKDCNAAIALKPTDDYLYLLRAYAYTSHDLYPEMKDRVFHTDSIYKPGYTERLEKKYRVEYTDSGVRLYDYAKAITSLDTALGLKRDCLPCLHLRARLHKALSNNDQAMKDMNLAIAMNPEKADLYIERALIHQARGEMRQAYYDLTTAIEQEPANPSGYLNRAVLLYEKMNNQASACLDFKQARILGAQLPAYAADCQ